MSNESNSLPAGINIRPARLEDAETIAEFNMAMALETENTVLDTARIYPGVRHLIGNSAHGQYWVAEADNQLAGCLAVTYEWSDWRNGQFWWIQSVYVRHEFRRRGVYRGLYAQVRNECLARDDVIGLRLYVEKDNLNAQSTYEKLGMNPTHYLIFEEEFAPAQP